MVPRKITASANPELTGLIITWIFSNKEIPLVETIFYVR